MQRQTISAHEMNKYAYCPYQWYYERLYGRKELRRLYKERNERLQLEDSLHSHFAQGEQYHTRSYNALRLRETLGKIVMILLVLGLISGYLVVKYGLGR